MCVCLCAHMFVWMHILYAEDNKAMLIKITTMMITGDWPSCFNMQWKSGRQIADTNVYYHPPSFVFLFWFYMTSTKNSHGFPMAILKDCRLPERSGGICPSSRGIGGKLRSLGAPRRALARLPVSVSLLPLPAGLADFRSDFSFSFFFSLLPDALLPARDM